MLSNKDISELELMLHNGFMKWKEGHQNLQVETSKLMDMYLKEIKQLSAKKYV